jgi:sacsin
VPAGGELKRPADLYDPTIPELRALLDSERHFPSGTFTAPAVLIALRGLGLRSSLDHQGILDSAREVCRVAQLQSGEAATAVTRAKGLLHYINMHNHRLFGDDRDTEASGSGDDGAEENAIGAPEDGDGGADIDANEDFYVGANEADRNSSAPEIWLKQLVGLPWLPVLLDSPEMHIPWTGNKHTRPGERLPGVMTLAAAGCVRPPADMWLVSFSQYVLDGEPCAKLSKAFGWNEPIPSRVLATQLVHLARLSLGGHGDALHNKLVALLPQLYKLLSEAAEDTIQLHVIQKILRGSPFVWVGNTFASVRLVGMSGHVDLRPYAYTLPPEMLRFAPLLQKLGLAEHLSRPVVCGVLKRMHTELNGAACSPTQLDFAVRTLELVAKDLGNADKLSDVGQEVYVPQTEGIMVLAGGTMYDDAPWLSSTLNGSMRPVFVHPKLSNELAAIFGAGSLRALLLLNGEFKRNIMCPSTESVRNCLVDLTSIDDHHALLDVLEVCDLLQAKRVSIVHDARSFPTTSLFSPMLAPLQGPALVLHIDRALTAEDVVRIQMAPGNGFGGVSVGSRDTHLGHGLMSAYRYTDAPVIVSGDSLFIFDPLGAHVTPVETDELSLPQAKAKAKQSSARSNVAPQPSINCATNGRAFVYVGTDVGTRFPDMFRPFEALPFGFASYKPFAGTIIRLPLRQQPSAISDACFEYTRVQQMYSSLKTDLSVSLLFCAVLESLSVSVWEDNADKPQRFHTSFVQSSTDIQETRRKLALNTEWRKSSLLSSFFTAGWKPVQNLHELNIVVQDGMNVKSVHDTWLVCNTLGAGRSRDIALREMQVILIPKLIN